MDQSRAQTEARFLEADRARELLFDTILSQLAASSLFSNSDYFPGIFIVYAHDNEERGSAYQSIVRQLIRWLETIYAQILSDQSPLPPLRHRIEGNAAIRDILANQICILPPNRDHSIPKATSVDKIIVCGSEVLEQYCGQPSAQDYIRDIVQICNTYPYPRLEEELQRRIDAEIKTRRAHNEEFHHILTEVAFLEVRASSMRKEHGMLPVMLSQISTNDAPINYLAAFSNTEVKLKLKSSTIESQHKLFFKLLGQLFPNDRDFIAPFRECYDFVSDELKLKQGSSVTRRQFDDVVSPNINKAYYKYWALFSVFVRDGKLQAYGARRRQHIEDLLKHIDQDRQTEILNWLSTVPVSELHGKFKDLGTSRLEGTCDWIVQSEEFCQWHSSEISGLLFLRAEMGMGKTYSTSRVIDWVKQGLSTNNHHEAFAYFYCYKHSPERSEAKSILRSLIRQLAIGPWKEETGENLTVHKTINDLWEKSRRQGIGSTFAEWEACLLALIDTYPRTTIVLDALDECEKAQQKHLIRFLLRISSQKPGSGAVKVFISARPEADLIRHLGPIPSMRIQNSGDIERFVRAKITEHDGWSWMPDTFETEIINTVIQKSGNMFLFASLQIQQLLRCATRPAVKARLAGLPDTLQTTYKDIYESATKEDDERQLMNRALLWVLYSVRPLTTPELLLAISQDPALEDVLQQREDVDEALILKLCHNLLSLEPRALILGKYREPVWRVAHQAVAEILGGWDSLVPSMSHYECGKVCLMMVFDVFGGRSKRCRGMLDDVRETGQSYVCPCGWKPVLETGRGMQYHKELRSSFAEYASYAWPTHVRGWQRHKSKDTPGLSQILNRFLIGPKDGSITYKRWSQHAFQKDIVYTWSIFGSRRMPWTLGSEAMAPLSLACYLGLHTILDEWWFSPAFEQNIQYRAIRWLPWPTSSHGGILPREDSFTWSLVALACAHDEEDPQIVERLLQRRKESGAHFNTEDVDEVPPLVATAIGDSEKAAKELLKYGVDICSSFTNRYAPTVVFSIRSGSLKVLQLLLDRFFPKPSAVEAVLASVQTQDFRSERAVTILLDKCIDVNTPLKNGTLLAAAVSNGWETLVKKLLDGGANVNVEFDGPRPESFIGSRGLRVRSALETSVCIRSVKDKTASIVYLLLDEGAGVSIRVVKLVCIQIEQLQSVHRQLVPDDRLHGILRRLLQELPDKNEKHAFEYAITTCALIEALKLASEDEVVWLLKNGADPNLWVGGRYGNVVGYVFYKTLSRVYWGDTYPTARMIRALVDAGANYDNMPSDRLDIALAGAAWAGLEDEVVRLLEHGANPNSCCEHQWSTALGAAAASEHPRAPDIILLLLDAAPGANINTKLENKMSYYTDNLGIDGKTALDFPLGLMLYNNHAFYIHFIHDDRLNTWLRSAAVLLSRGAVWDLNFAEWRYCLEKCESEFAREHSEDLDKLQRLFFERNRDDTLDSGTDDQCKTKNAKAPVYGERWILSQMEENNLTMKKAIRQSQDPTHQGRDDSP